MLEQALEPCVPEFEFQGDFLLWYDLGVPDLSGASPYSQVVERKVSLYSVGPWAGGSSDGSNGRSNANQPRKNMAFLL